MSEIKRFKDIPEFQREELEGEMVDIETILGKEIVFKTFSLNQSFTYEGDFAIIQVQLLDSDKPVLFSCGGGLILKYLKIAREKGYFPFKATISKKEGKSGNSYYVLE